MKKKKKKGKKNHHIFDCGRFKVEKISEASKQASKELSNTFLEKMCREINYVATTSVNRIILYGHITKILNETTEQ